MWRTYGRWYGVPVVLLDTAKGFVPALVFSLTVSPLAGVLAGAGAMLGHARPLFLKFERGGKMVATTGGAFLGVAPLVAAVGAVVWLAVFLLFRYASLASIAGAVSLPIAAVAARRLVGGDRLRRVRRRPPSLFLHRGNVKRLLRGEESRFTLLRRKKAAGLVRRDRTCEPLERHEAGSSGAIVRPKPLSFSQ